MRKLNKLLAGVSVAVLASFQAQSIGCGVGLVSGAGDLCPGRLQRHGLHQIRFRLRRRRYD